MLNNCVARASRSFIGWVQSGVYVLASLSGHSPALSACDLSVSRVFVREMVDTDKPRSFRASTSWFRDSIANVFANLEDASFMVGPTADL